MSDYGSVVLPTHIHTFTEYGAATNSRNNSAPTPFIWVNNEASYQPLFLPFPYLVRRMFWVNGSSVSSTNVDVGIYTPGGTRLYSTGSTAAVGGSAVQYVVLGTPLLLTPGRYYLAWACNLATNRAWGFSGSTAHGSGLLSQASAMPLPATATFAAYTGTGMPTVGITNTDSGF